MKNYNTQEEVWEDIQGFEGYYQVSNLGSVRSLDRGIIYSNGRKELRKGKVLTPQFNKKNGYMSVVLRKGEQNQRRFYIHRLVAFSFCENPQNKPEVNHKDEIKTNNH
jgi:hypothetical protein